MRHRPTDKQQLDLFRIQEHMEKPDPRDPAPAVPTPAGTRFRMGTVFKDGPAAGVELMLHRAPLALRVTQNKSTGEWDALDQAGDTPKRNEHLHLYVLDSVPGYFHIRPGGVFRPADYRVAPEQPPRASMEDDRVWSEFTWYARAKLLSWTTPAVLDVVAAQTAKQLSDPQRSWIRALADGRDPTERFKTQSDHGGAAGTHQSLKRLAILENNDLSSFGRLVVAKLDLE